ncbi:MAG TPA: YceH family protein [Candidatus Saccharimonadia bacterium]|nr:YceH family protein [Candidatus Saccharimonadia bacterium]
MSSEIESENDPHVRPALTRVEARALGVLIEKSATTPDLYPMTLNAIVVGANQKTSRHPLLELDPGEVGHALRTLEDKGFVAVVHGARALRYEHRIDEALALTRRQRAVLCVLMLRGAQTQNELFVRCDRLADFTGPEDLRETLERLSSRMPPLAVRIPRHPGQREDRYAHLLCGEPEIGTAEPDPMAATGAARSALEQRIEALEARVAVLEQASLPVR